MKFKTLISLPFILVTIKLIFPTLASTQTEINQLIIPDTNQTSDTLDIDEQYELADTLETEILEIEVLQPIIPIPLIGSIKKDISDLLLVTSKNIQNYDHRYSYDLLEFFPGIMLYKLGSPGQPHPLIINKLDTRSIGILNNGIALNDPLTGTYNMHQFPLEDIYRQEYIPGSRSFLYGLNSTGGTINLVSKNFPEGIRDFNSKRKFVPYSKIRYSESAYEETFFDGMLSQNLLHNLNITGGVQRVFSEGRFSNSAYDSWNVRAKFRYNLSNNINIYLSEIYNQNKLGLNGGIDLENTRSDFIFDRLQAVVRNPVSYERIARNDLQFGIAAALLPDSTSLSRLTLYLSNQMRYFRDNQNQSSFPGVLMNQDHHSRWMGVKFNQRLNLLPINNSANLLSLDFGTEFHSKQVMQSSVIGYNSSTLFSLFGIGEFKPIELISMSTYTRFDNYLKLNRIGFGGDVDINLIKGLKLYGGYSNSYRFPTFQELYWRDSSITSDVNTFNPEQHQLLEIGVNYKLSHLLNLNINFFNRNIDNHILIEPTDYRFLFPSLKYIVKNEATYQGINANASLTIWKLSGRVNGSYYLNTDNDGYFPDLILNGEVFFHDRFFGDHLHLKVGVRGRTIAKQNGFEFNPQTLILVPSVKYKIGGVGSFDVILLAKIGQATVHIVVENVLDNQYAITTYYPVLDRSLRFGINWEFEN